MDTSLDIALYLRKSQQDREREAEAAKRGEIYDTLSRHRRELLDIAKKRHYNIIDIFEEVVSGAHLALRPEMNALLENVKARKYDAVLVVDIARLGRGDKVEQGVIERVFKQSDTMIITTTEMFDLNADSGEFSVEVNTFLSRMEYRQIKKRLHAGIMRSTGEGKDVSKKPPYGYRKDENLKLIIHPEEAEIVKYIFQMCIEGKGQMYITNELANMKVPSPSGNETWSNSTINRMIKNPKYKGDQVYGRKQTVRDDNGKVTIREKALESRIVYSPDSHEAIISKEDWDKAQYSISNRSTHTVRKKNLVNVFAGLLRCKKCGKILISNTRSSRSGVYLYCKTPGCDTKGIAMWKVEKALLENLADTLKNINVKDTDGSESSKDKIVKVLQKKLNGLLQEQEKDVVRRENLYDLLEDGTYDKDTFVDRMQVVQERTKEREYQIEELRGNIENAVEDQERRINLVPAVHSALDSYEKAPTAQIKNDILKGIIEAIYYERSDEYSGPLDFTIHVYLLG